MLSEALAVGFNQAGAMLRFLLTHVFEQFGGSGIGFAKAVGEIGEDTPILFFQADRHRQDFAFGQIFELACHSWLLGKSKSQFSGDRSQENCYSKRRSLSSDLRPVT